MAIKAPARLPDHPSHALARAQRVKRDPRPSDLAQAQINERIAQYDALRPVVNTDEFNQIANLIANLFGEYEAKAFSLSPEYKQVSFYTYKSNFTRWTDLNYLAITSAFDQLDPDGSAMTESRDRHTHEHTYKWDFENGFSIKVQFSASENKDTSECRQVQIGTRVVEEPIYKYDCVMEMPTSGDLPPPAPLIDVKAI
jgi:hypothetical protein